MSQVQKENSNLSLKLQQVNTRESQYGLQKPQ